MALPKVNQKLLSKEIVPFSPVDFRLGGLPIVDNPDPVLRYLALRGEEEYRTMERAEPTIGTAKRTRVNTLLSFGTHVQSGSKTAASRLLRDFTVSALKGINDFRTVQRLMLDAIYWGWRPMEVTYSTAFRWRGRERWVPKKIREKKPEQFRFTLSRDLCYIGNGMITDPIVFDQPEDRYNWIVCTAGSTDNPYGDALFKGVWLVYYIKQRFMQMWSQGMARSIGVVSVKQTADASGSLLGEGSKKMEEVVGELRDVLRALNEKGILVQKFGWTVDLLSDIDFSEGWKHPLAYCDEIITLAILGETLTQKIGAQGSRAAADTHRAGLLDFCKSDAPLLETWMSDNLIAPMLELNFGEIDPDDLPKFRSRLSTAIDLEKARVLWALGATLDGVPLADDAGVPIIIPEGTEEVPLERPQKDPGETQALPADSQKTGHDGGKAKHEAKKKHDQVKGNAAAADSGAVERVAAGFRSGFRAMIAEILGSLRSSAD